MEPEFRSMAEQRRYEYLIEERDKLFTEQFVKMMEEDMQDPIVVDDQSKPVRFVAFDVDGCLFDEYDRPRWDVIDILRAFVNLGWGVSVWSGSGVEYAVRKMKNLGLMPLLVGVVPKGGYVPDIAFDDQDVTLGKANVRI